MAQSIGIIDEPVAPGATDNLDINIHSNSLIDFITDTNTPKQEWPKGCQIPLSYHPVPDMTGFRDPLKVQSLTSAKSKFLSLAG